MPLDRPAASGGQVLSGKAVPVTREVVPGPLPPPALLAEYDKAVEGLADRIVAMAESEGKHRRAVENRLIRLSELGLLTGFVLSLFAIGGGILLAWTGKGLQGLAPLVLSIVGIVTIFVLRRNTLPADNVSSRA